jgi:hypothetical protein
VSTSWIGIELGVEWREVSAGILKREGFEDVFKNLGWLYVHGKGRRAGKFERIVPRLEAA